MQENKRKLTLKLNPDAAKVVINTLIAKKQTQNVFEYTTVDKKLKNKNNSKNNIKNIKKPLDLAVEAIYKRLHELYPNVINNRKFIPLKVGIHEDIAKALNISKNKARDFCSWYCGTEYRRKIKLYAKRYDLEGNKAGRVRKLYSKNKNEKAKLPKK